MTLEEYFNNLTEASNLGLAKKVSRESVKKDPIDNLDLSNDAISRLVIKTFDKVVSNNGVSVSTLDIPKIKSPDIVVGKWNMFFKELGDQSGIAMMVKSGSIIENRIYLLAAIYEISDINDTTHWDNVHTRYLTPAGVLPIWTGRLNYHFENEDEFYKQISSTPTISYLADGVEVPFVWATEPGVWWEKAWVREDYNEIVFDLKMLAKTLDEKIKLAEHDVLYRKNLFKNYVITQ